MCPHLDSKIALAAVISAVSLAAQELEPRAYSVSPVGTNFVVVSTTRASGDISFDPSLPLEHARRAVRSHALSGDHGAAVLHVAGSV